MTWTIDILSLDGTSTLETAAAFRTARITWALDGPGAAEITLIGSDITAGDWLTGRRRIKVKDTGGTARFGGWLDRLERAGKPGKIRYRASARGLAAILEQRVVHGDFAKVNVVATTIATDLIAHMVAQTFDETNFTAGTITGVAPTRSRWFCDGDVIRDSIDELANLSNGFAWEISPTGAFNAWVGGRGTDLSGSVTLAPADTIDWQCTDDMTNFATFVTALGDQDDEGPCGAPLAIDWTADRTDFGRREVVVSVDTRNEPELLEAGTEELRASRASGKNLKVAWVEGEGPWAFGAVWLGDVISAVLGTEFGGTTDMRLINVSVTLEPGTHEFVEYEFENA